MSYLAASQLARWRRRRPVIARDRDAVPHAWTSLPREMAADLGVPGRPPVLTTTAAGWAEPVRGHSAGAAEAAQLPPGKIVVQLHDIE